MNKYSFFLCATLALLAPVSRAMQQPQLASNRALKAIAKQVCGCTLLGSGAFFAGHEWGKKKGYQEGFFAGEIHATANITTLLADHGQNLVVIQKLRLTNSP